MDKTERAARLAALRVAGPMDAEMIGLPALAETLCIAWGIELNEAARELICDLQEAPDGLALYQRFANSRPQRLSTHREPGQVGDGLPAAKPYWPSYRDRALEPLIMPVLCGHRLGEQGTPAEKARTLGVILKDAIAYFDLQSKTELWPLPDGELPTKAHLEAVFRMRHKFRMTEEQIAAKTGRTRPTISAWIGPAATGLKAREFGKLGDPSPELMADCGLTTLQKALPS